MLMSDYTAELLNLEDVIITGVENISDQLHIYIELPRKKHVCPAVEILQTVSMTTVCRRLKMFPSPEKPSCTCVSVVTAVAAESGSSKRILSFLGITALPAD